MSRTLAKHVPEGATEVPRGFRVDEVRNTRYFVRKGYRLEDCPGEAHRNAHIDNCMRCAPLWGVVAVEDD